MSTHGLAGRGGVPYLRPHWQMPGSVEFVKLPATSAPSSTVTLSSRSGVISLALSQAWVRSHSSRHRLRLSVISSHSASDIPDRAVASCQSLWPVQPVG